MNRSLNYHCWAALVAAGVVLFSCTDSKLTVRPEAEPTRFISPLPAELRSDWVTFGWDVQRTGFNPVEGILGPGNAGSLALAWTADLGGAVIGSPVLASSVEADGTPRDLVYVGNENGHLHALDAWTGEVVWERYLGAVKTDCQDMPNGRFGITGTPAIDRSANRIYVAAGDGAVYALDLGTGAIQPGWPVTITQAPEREQVYGGINQYRDGLFVALASVCLTPPFHGRAVMIDTATARVTHEFYVIPADGPSGGGVWGPGGVSIDPSTGAVYIATGNALTEPEHFAFAEHVVRLTPNLRLEAANHPGIPGVDSDFGSTPLLFDPRGCPPQLAVQNKRGILFVYERDAIGRGPTQRIQVSNVEGWAFIGLPAYSPVARTLYITTPSDSEPFRRGLVAMRVKSDCSLSLDWQASIAGEEGVASRPLSPPSLANGVVYLGSGAEGEVLAFDGETGEEVWASGDAMEGKVVAAPIVVNGTVYAGTGDGHFYAFSLPQP